MREVEQFLRDGSDYWQEVIARVANDADRELLVAMEQSDSYPTAMYAEVCRRIAVSDADPVTRELCRQQAELLDLCGEIMFRTADLQHDFDKRQAFKYLSDVRDLDAQHVIGVTDRTAVDVLPADDCLWIAACIGRGSRRTRRTRSGASSGSSDDGDPSSGLEPPSAVIYAAAAAFATRASFDRTAPAVSAWLQAWGDERAGGLA